MVRPVQAGQLLPIEDEGEKDGEIAEGDVVISSHDGFPPRPAIVERADKTGNNEEERNQWSNAEEYHSRFLGEAAKNNRVIKDQVVKNSTARMACTTVS